MELCDCNLKDILDKYKPNGLPINIIKKIFTQLNEALKIMVEKNYYHRDLKPENILIKYTDKNKTNFDIKLTDFGLSSNEINSIVQTHSNVGSEKYRAPEVDYFEYNNKSDLWSLGIILYELYTNKYIFDSKNPRNRKNNREKGKIEKETNNDMINKLIRKLIQVDIDKRIGWEEYFNDDFFK
jgi:serine/threonine protein kinase